MHRTFWSGLLWGGFIGALLGAAANAANRRPEPLINRGVGAVADTTRELQRKTRRLRKKWAERLD